MDAALAFANKYKNFIFLTNHQKQLSIKYLIHQYLTVKSYLAQITFIHFEIARIITIYYVQDVECIQHHVCSKWNGKYSYLCRIYFGYISRIINDVQSQNISWSQFFKYTQPILSEFDLDIRKETERHCIKHEVPPCDELPFDMYQFRIYFKDDEEIYESDSCDEEICQSDSSDEEMYQSQYLDMITAFGYYRQYLSLNVIESIVFIVWNFYKFELMNFSYSYYIKHRKNIKDCVYQGISNKSSILRNYFYKQYIENLQMIQKQHFIDTQGLNKITVHFQHSQAIATQYNYITYLILSLLWSLMWCI